MSRTTVEEFAYHFKKCMELFESMMKDFSQSLSQEQVHEAIKFMSSTSMFPNPHIIDDPSVEEPAAPQQQVDEAYRYLSGTSMSPPSILDTGHPDSPLPDNSGHAVLIENIKKESGFPDIKEPWIHASQCYEAQIRWMNKLFNLDVNTKPTDLGVSRLLKHYKSIINEVTELLDCINNEAFVKSIREIDPFLEDTDIDELIASFGEPLTVNMTALADTLGDINIYNASEFVRWGLPKYAILNAIMESQVTKLDSDGQPVMAEDNSKFIKGPYFEGPEDTIRHMLETLGS